MNIRIRLVCCVLLAGCGAGGAGTQSAGSPLAGPPLAEPPPAEPPLAEPPPAEPPPDESGAPVPVGDTECAAAAAGTGYPAALLRIGCDGGVVPGRADWSREGSAVTLEFGGVAEGPVGVELVSAWPPLGEPPWLGHPVENITVLSGGRVEVRFGVPAGREPDEPERLFADPRLSGVGMGVREGDVRDAIDAGSRVLTRHDASVEYARSLGRPVALVAFDRLYLVAFSDAIGVREAGEAGRAIGVDWLEWGATGARRPPSLRWEEVVARCGEGVPVGGAVATQPGRGADPASPTVGYPGGDPAARRIAERIVSLALRRDRAGGLIRTLAGTDARLALRARTGSEPGRAATDVAAVTAVQAGPGHPCSLRAEILRDLAEWEPRRGALRTNVLPVGETALFLVGESALFETWRP